MPSFPNSILIVDDSDEVRTIVRTFLERDATFRVCGEACSGLEAIKRAQELKPDLILLDLKLPGMSGMEVARALKDVLPTTKLVLFTAYADSFGSKAWASAVGVDLVLSKGSLIDMTESLKTLAAKSV
jgi:two-component system nitrate/nitrite response regulator NarL